MECFDDSINLGWLCGILEGEGAFIISKDKRRPTTYTCKIQVESTDKDVVEKIQILFPGRIWESNYPSKYKTFPNAKPSWRWAISTKRQCLLLLELIYPYMSKRRQEQLDKLRPGLIYQRRRKL